MTRWRSCWAVAALLCSTACGDSAEVGPGAVVVTASPTVELGPLPTQPAPAPIAVTSSTGSTTPRATSIPSTITSTSTSTSTIPGSTSTGVTPVPTSVRAPQRKTSCTEVAYIGDSISLGMVSTTTPQRPTAEFERLMAEVGVTDLQVEVSGGRSIVETLPGQENAVTVAQRLREAGFAGCWVIAIGTNDAANISAGAARQADERVAAIMSVVGSDPVLWIDAASVATSGYWAVPNVEEWDRVLAADIASYPSARVAPWSGYVRSEWFESDGIHVTAAGAAARAKFVANALAVGFPLT